VKKQLRILAADRDTTIQDLRAEALKRDIILPVNSLCFAPLLRL
jgi:hypothetical protein